MKITTKTLIVIALCGLGYSSMAQSGSDCSTAVPVNTDATCNYSNYTTSGTTYWLQFVATSPTVNISLITTKYGIDAPHIHALNLFDGSCGSLNLIADDELPFYDEAKELTIDLNASDLVVGQTYYIRADREAIVHECTRTNCKMNGSTDPTTFSLCIQDITVVIPPDYDDEVPTSGLALETNRGQVLYSDGLTVAEEVKMFNTSTNPAIYVCEDHVSYVVYGDDGGTPSYQRVDMDFVDAKPNYGIFRTEQVSGVKNYYLPHIPDGVTRNKSYSRVVSNDIYSNIDLQHYSNKEGMKNYYVIRPGGDYEDIVMKFTGATGISLTGNDLRVEATLGNIEFEKPHIYYVNPGGQVVPMPFDVYYEVVGTDKVKFSIPGFPSPPPMTMVIQMDQGHSPAAPKAIDNLVWSTFYGGAEDDFIEDVDHDQAGNVYFTGATRGLLFPLATQTIYSTTFTATRMIVGSHEPLGEHRWSTIYGGQQDYGSGVATDNLGNVYVVGASGVYSEPNQFIDIFQAGAYNLAPITGTTSATYATIFKFNQSNGAATWASLFGEHTANSYFLGWCIATDDLGNVYIAGDGERKTSSPLIGTGTQFLQSTSNNKVGFIAKFNSANALTWSTMFGNDDIRINEMNTANNNLYIVGTAGGTNLTLFPLMAEAPNDYLQPFAGGTSDAFFAKFDVNNELKWSSFFGGTSNDEGRGIDYHSGLSSLYLSGKTNSTSGSFPLQSLPDPLVHFNSTLNGASDGYISVLKYIPETTGGHTLHYSSYYGGASEDWSGNIELSGQGSAYAIGMTKSTNFPLHQLTNGYYQTTLENDPTGIHFDSYVVGLNPDLQLEWSTLYGGEWYYMGTDNVSAQSNDDGNGITVYNDQIVYIGGDTPSDESFPITVDLVASPNAYIQYDNSGDPSDIPDGWRDGFLAQFNLTGTVLTLEELNSTDVFGDLVVYPNPNNGEFVITSDNLSNSGTLRLEVVNVVGQSVYRKNLDVQNGSIHEVVNLKNCATGIYVIKLSSGNSSVSKKIVVN